MPHTHKAIPSLFAEEAFNVIAHHNMVHVPTTGKYICKPCSQVVLSYIEWPCCEFYTKYLAKHRKFPYEREPVNYA